MRKKEEKQKGLDQLEDRKSKPYGVMTYMKGVTERLQREHSVYEVPKTDCCMLDY